MAEASVGLRSQEAGRTVGRYLDRGVETLSNLGAAVGVVAVFGMTAMITVDVLLRYVFSSPLAFADEYSAYLYMTIAYVGLGYTTRKDAHINVDFVTQHFSSRVRVGLDVLTSTLSLFLICVLFYYVVVFWLDCIKIDRRAEGVLSTPLWIPVTTLWIGLLVFGMEVAVRIVKNFVEFLSGPQGTTGENVTQTPVN